MQLDVSARAPHASIGPTARWPLAMAAAMAGVLLTASLSSTAFAQSDQYSTSGARSGGNIVSDADAWWQKHDDTFRRRSQQCRPLLAQAETFRLRAEDFRIDARAPQTPSSERTRLQREANNQQGQAGALVRQFYDCSGRAQSDQIQTQGQQGQAQPPRETPRPPRFDLNAQVENQRDPVAPPPYPGPRRVDGGVSGGTTSGASSSGPARVWTGSAVVPDIPKAPGARDKYGRETVYVTIIDMHRHPNEPRYDTWVDFEDAAHNRVYLRADGTVDQQARTFTIRTLTLRGLAAPHNQIVPPRPIVVRLR